MSYRIRYEIQKTSIWKWSVALLCAGIALWCAEGMAPVWRYMAAGEGLYDALARYVGGLILGAHGS